jgi:hypothetical protein
MAAGTCSNDFLGVARPLNLRAKEMNGYVITFDTPQEPNFALWPPAPLPSTDPLERIIWENIAYLASDERRAEAFATLKRSIGTRPEQILAAQHSTLAAIGKAGILPDVTAEKLLAIAKIANQEFDGDLRVALEKSLPHARKAFETIPQHWRIPLRRRFCCSPVHTRYSRSTPMDCEVPLVAMKESEIIEDIRDILFVPYPSKED